MVWTLNMTLFAATSVDVSTIAEKFEKLGKWEFPQAPEYTIYDPFRRAEPLMKRAKTVQHKPKPVALKITAIMNGRAFVNGRWVGAGERIDGYRVVEIRANGLVLKSRNRTIFLPLKQKKPLLKTKDIKQ